MATKSRAAPTGFGSPPTPNGDPLAGRVLVDARPSAPAPEERRPSSPAPRFRLRQGEPLPDGRVRAPRREVEVAIEGYPGFTAWIWSNYPRRLGAVINANADEESVVGALRAIVIEHNGWADADGEPYPPADDPAFYDAIPLELGAMVLRAISTAPAAYPNSLNGTGGR